MWFKVDDRALHHKKFRKAANDLGGSHALSRVVTVWLAGGTYSSQHNHTGELPLEAVVGFSQFVHRPLRCAKALCEAGLWKAVNGGFQIHDFNEYNPTPEQVASMKKRRNDRANRYRARRKAQSE